MNNKIKNSFIFDKATVTIEEMTKYENEIMSKYSKEWKETKLSFELQVVLMLTLSKYQVDIKDKLFTIKNGRTENEH